MSKFRTLVESMLNEDNLFNQIQFMPHPELSKLPPSLEISRTKIGRIFFNNGCGVSVMTGETLIDPTKFECALLKGTPDNYKIAEDSWGNDIIFRCEKPEVESLLQYVQSHGFNDGEDFDSYDFR